MSKNKKIVLISISLLVILTAAVLLIRTPSTHNTPVPEAVPPPAKVEESAPTPPKESNRDESHEKVEKVIDQATEVVVGTVPGIMDKLKSTGKWFMEFDTKHALILLGVGVFLVGVLSTGNRNNKSNKNR
ncbi:hypothetical protein [Paenibacillus sp. 1A_MP2]|uniref:hypothetical protein n=1 Tax=Paenibacillus sp. 1A_MP2 TaxID=3457495 RepID=UPI003FCC4AF0